MKLIPAAIDSMGRPVRPPESYRPEISERLASEAWMQPEEVALDRLNVDEAYQVKPSPSRIANIARDFQRSAFDPIVVSRRADGTMWVIDGRHRCEAARKVALLTVPAYVHDGMALAEEAAMYARKNTCRKTPSALTVFNARLLAGDPVCVAIMDCATTSGFKIGTFSARGPGHLNCVTELAAVYARGGKPLVTRTLGFLARAWPGDPGATNAFLVCGVATLIERHAGEVGEEAFRKALSAVSVEQIRRAVLLRARDSGQSPARVCYHELVAIFNRKKRVNRLPDASHRGAA